MGPVINSETQIVINNDSMAMNYPYLS
jgi:hypothetical protein